MSETGSKETVPRPTYRWPWFVAVLVLLGIVLAVLLVSAEVRRIKQQRTFESEPAMR